MPDIDLDAIKKRAQEAREEFHPQAVLASLNDIDALIAEVEWLKDVSRWLRGELHQAREASREAQELLKLWITESHGEYEVFTTLGADEAPEHFKRTYAYFKGLGGTDVQKT